jgi:hypothetical protein
MNNSFFSHVLDDPLFVGNGEYVSVVTSGKMNVVGEERDINKDAAAKAGLIRIDSINNKTTFIDFTSLSEPGDRYRGAVVVDNTVYVMRTQKKHIDSVVRIVACSLSDNRLEMIEEKAVTIHGTETPKTFCGHFNFGRPIVVGKKIIYPPLNSGVILVFDTETHKTVAHDIPNTFSSIWSTFVPELNEVVFFPYGNKSTQLLILSLDTNQYKLVDAPVASTFYSAFTHEGKAIGVPYIMDDLPNIHFWIYDGNEITTTEYKPSAGMNNGFKYGTSDNNVFYTHTSGELSNELVRFDLTNKQIDIIPTNLALGAKPIIVNGNPYLFPSIQNTRMLDAPAGVYTVVNGQIVKEFNLPTNNISYSPINGTDSDIVLVPYKFELIKNKLHSQLSIVNISTKAVKTLNIELDLE